MAVRRRLEAMNTALHPSLSPSAGAAVEAAVVLPDPPSNWPRWAPYPRFKTVPRFELGDPAAQEYLAAEGYVVIANVLSSDEVATGLSKFWDQLEKLNPGLVRSDSSTYGNWGNTTGWGHDEALWYIRGLPRVKKVWEHVYDTSELLVSFDGANIQRPWGLNGDWRGNAGGMHLDRRNAEGYEDDYVQGFVNLRPVTEATGGNYVLPRSNQHYDFIQQRREQWQAQTAGQKDRPDFYQVLAEERPEIFQEFITAAMEPGDVFLWSDKTIHSACPGVGVGPTEADLMRCAVYVCMSPRDKATPEVLEQRRAAVDYGTGNGHTSHHPINIPDNDPQHPYGLEKLTPQQRALVG